MFFIGIVTDTSLSSQSFGKHVLWIYKIRHSTKCGLFSQDGLHDNSDKKRVESLLSKGVHSKKCIAQH